MTNIQFSKEQISIQQIGRQRFWIGIVAGLISAISISLVFNHFREVYRFFITMSADLLILADNELQFFNYFFSSFATTLGFSVTIWIWMSNRTHNRRLDRLYKQLSRVNALLVFWIFLMVIARFGSIPPGVLYGMPGYDNHFNLYHDFWILFLLIPLSIFMQSWAPVRLVYRSGKWLLLSLLFCIMTVFSLKMTTTVNQEKLNNSYRLRFEKDYLYIDQEMSKAKAEYGIEFKKKTIDILKKWHSESSVEQVISIKTAFSESIPVSLDTILLQKIVIRNFKHGGKYYARNSSENWQYALPKDILKQIQLYDINSYETKELFEVLKEAIDLMNTLKIDLDEFPDYTETERRRSLNAGSNIPLSIKRQLHAVKYSLLNDARYSDFAKNLPKINEDKIIILQ
jgi:hypothetical protein